MNIFERHELLLDVIKKVDYRLGRNLFIINESRHLIGVISQGDLVKILSKDISVKSLTLNDVMNLNPIYLVASEKPNEIYREAHKVMLERGINEIPVLNNDGSIRSVVNSLDLLTVE